MDSLSKSPSLASVDYNQKSPSLAEGDLGGGSIKHCHENVGLICDRGCKLQEINNVFISDKIVDLHLNGSGSYIFPL
ncbi:DNA methyltransferase [Campylobacter troglodytis]|uniref:DNA methyltransferase n=1 Tax=Campylobacter troglodytis TaxID=654363 RepID=UPI001FEC7221|nr:DNA methyltransferase [Campylobacter troglodytis]